MENKRTKKNPMLFTRVEPSIRDEAQRVADREYDGNLSLLVRLAVKAFIAKVDRKQASEGAEAA